jgi:rhamnosyltransferase
VHHAYPQPQRIGALCANYRSPGSGLLAYPAGPVWHDVTAPVTSGTLLALTAVSRAGAMRDAFFIECIDIEFALRLRAAGLRLIASGRPLMTHGAGEALERRFFGRVVLVGNHAPWRCFLQYRNLTWTLLRYVVREPRWAAQSFLALFKKGVLVLLYERDRPAKLWAMCRGVFAGIGWFVTGGAGSPAAGWK